MGKVAAYTTLAALVLYGIADTAADDTAAPATASEVSPPQNRGTPTSPPPGRVYNTSEVGLIIGGASKDAKAKIGRLPVHD